MHTRKTCLCRFVRAWICSFLWTTADIFNVSNRQNNSALVSIDQFDKSMDKFAICNLNSQIRLGRLCPLTGKRYMNDWIINKIYTYANAISHSIKFIEIRILIVDMDKKKKWKRSNGLQCIASIAADTFDRQNVMNIARRTNGKNKMINRQNHTQFNYIRIFNRKINLNKNETKQRRRRRKKPVCMSCVRLNRCLSELVFVLFANYLLRISRLRHQLKFLQSVEPQMH